ncbi:MAG: hypothetical protein WD154_07695 [Nitrosopumilaceae archaeon]
MPDKISGAISSIIDSKISNELLTEWNDLLDAHSNEKIKILRLSTHFIENIFRALEFLRTNKRIDEVPQQKINEIISDMKQLKKDRYDDRIRIVVPSVAYSMLTLRSKIGSHVKSYSELFSDAVLFLEMGKWILLQFLILSKADEKVMKILLDTNVQHTNENIIESLVVKKIQDIKLHHCILFAIYLNKKLTKERIKLILKKWGKKYKKSWWQGGNFNHRVFDEFLEKNEDFFIVNQKGKLKIKELISELRE